MKSNFNYIPMSFFSLYPCLLTHILWEKKTKESVSRSDTFSLPTCQTWLWRSTYPASVLHTKDSEVKLTGTHYLKWLVRFSKQSVLINSPQCKVLWLLECYFWFSNSHSLIRLGFRANWLGLEKDPTLCWNNPSQFCSVSDICNVTNVT